MTSTEKILKTWYQPDNPLYKNPEHPTIKLAGEIGELMDSYGKHTYKPGFDWMRCKNCGNIKNGTWLTAIKCDTCFPIVLDELGDIWYYLRILAWIYDVKLEYKFQLANGILDNIKIMYHNANTILSDKSNTITKLSLLAIFEMLNQLLVNLDYTLDELTELNYVKLNSDDTNHGWANA